MINTVITVDTGTRVMGVCISSMIQSGPGKRIVISPKKALRLSTDKSLPLFKRLESLSNQFSEVMRNEIFPGHTYVVIETPRQIIVKGHNAAGLTSVYASVGMLVGVVSEFNSKVFPMACVPVQPEVWTGRTSKDLHVKMALGVINDSQYLKEWIHSDDPKAQEVWRKSHRGSKSEAKILDDNVADAICIANYVPIMYAKGELNGYFED